MSQLSHLLCRRGLGSLLMHRAAVFVILYLFTVSTVFALNEFDAKVVGVMDGDTIEVLFGNQTRKVRLAQIDAPEKSQAFGQRSKQSLSDLVFGKHIRVVVETTDRYGRLVGRLYHGSVDINAEQVSKGMAWVYTKYATDQSFFEKEKEARSARRGLWSDASPIPPWEYRHGGKSATGISSGSKEDASSSSANKSSENNQEGTPTSVIPSRCGNKRRCKEMASCEEARFYLTECGVSSLDRDKDGIPCESLCR